jgi:hypothetical protein
MLSKSYRFYIKFSNYEKINVNGFQRTDMIQNINVSCIPQHDIRITLVDCGGGKLWYYNYLAWFMNTRGYDIESVFTFITGDTHSIPTS